MALGRTNEKLEAFLASNEPETPPAAPAPEPREAPKPEPQQAPPAEPKEPVAPPEAQQEPDDEVEPGDARGMVPRASLVDERNKRRDWKGKADKAEGEIAELRRQHEALQKQLEELRKPRPVPQPVQQQQPMQYQGPDPHTDPVAYTEWRLGHMAFNMSEAALRARIGDEAVDKLQDEFYEMAQAEPMLWHAIKQQKDPFGWAHREVERRRLLRDMGDDPAGYEAKLRAKWEAEQAAKQPQVALPQNTPPPPMPPSLAGVRSVATRTAPQWSGPLSDQQINQQNREWRMAQRR